MSPEEIRAACAELMGWTWARVPYDSDPLGRPVMGPDSYLAWKGDGICYPQTDWRPDEDRNQSRMVVQRALKVLDHDDQPHSPEDLLDVNMDIAKHPWMFATPAEECESALRATGRWTE